MSKNKIGARIKARREELGKSQQELADALKLPQTKISMIERGERRVKAEDLPVLARVLECPITWFYGYEDLKPDTLSVEALLKKWSPNVEYTDEQIQELLTFMEGVFKSYTAASPNFTQNTKERKREKSSK